MEKINAEVFLKVAECGSFRKAADALGYTQAGISYIIAAMEQESELNLFVREHNGVRLSEEGKAILPEIEQLAIWERHFNQSLNEINGLKRGTIRVQIFDSISVHWIPGIVRKFRDDYPGINIELITEENPVKAEEMVRSGDVDCGFFLTSVSADIDYYPLIEENLMAVVPENYDMKGIEKFPIKELGNHPYIAMAYDRYTGIGKIFTENRIKPNIAYCMDNDYAAMMMTKMGMGYCIFPELLLKSMPTGLKKMEFDIPQKRIISVGTASIKTCSKAAKKFIEYTREWVKEAHGEFL